MPDSGLIPSWKQRRSSRWLGIIGLAVVFTLIYSQATADTHAWVTVARDANYDIEIDRAQTKQVQVAAFGKWVHVIDTWYRTSHKLPRLHRDKEFDREVVHSLVRCDSLWFKVASVDMYRGDRRRVARQVTSGEELYRQRWRRVEHGTSEEIAARAACHFGSRAAPEVTSVR